MIESMQRTHARYVHSQWRLNLVFPVASYWEIFEDVEVVEIVEAKETADIALAGLDL